MPRSILVVDDHEVIRRQLRSLFNSYPEFTVCGEAVHGVDAIEKAQQLSPDLIILDLSMPEMNGLEAASALRFMMPTVPLFLLTAHYNRELELAAFGSGICAVFSKHEDLDSLVARARLELNLQQPGDGHSSTQEGS
ncbi:MAG: two component transcriptional regulator, LuxR family [Candidatus Acidoferrum typicum]|nr:two component transcriptional regulator, LuxR family [Candidatus Acidoferrum typicum]